MTHVPNDGAWDKLSACALGLLTGGALGFLAWLVFILLTRPDLPALIVDGRLMWEWI